MQNAAHRFPKGWSPFVWLGCIVFWAGLPLAACGDSSGESGSTTGGRTAGGAGPSTGGGASEGAADSAGGASSSTGGGSPRGDSTGGGSMGGDSMGGGSTSGGSTGAVQMPPANAPFDYQIGKAYAPPAGVLIVSRDREAEPAAGIYNICYVNGFQTQPEDNAKWLRDHPDLLLSDDSGAPVEDADWGEYLLDTSTAEKRAALLELERSWILGCKDAGFDAIEVDNLDSYSRSGGLLTQKGNVAFLRLLSDVAHEAGLAVGQKNSAELLDEAPAMGTDFAVVEECNRWDECADFEATYGGLVFIIEYRTQDFEKGCTDFPQLSIVLRDLDVSGPGSSSYVYDGC